MGGTSTRPGAPRRVPAGLPTFTFVVAFLAVLGVGILATKDDHPVIPLPAMVYTAGINGCDASAGSVGVSWSIDESMPVPPVKGVTLELTSGISACLTLPIVVSILDATGGVLASVTSNPLASDPGTTTSLYFDFSGHPGGGVPVPPIEGLRADVPDPFSADAPLDVPVPSGTDVTVSAIAPASDGSIVPISVVIPRTDGGTATFATSSQPLPASGFQAGSLQFDLSVADGIVVSPANPIQLCLYLDRSRLAAEPPALLHFVDGAWTTLTTNWDPATGQLCAAVDHLSGFALGTLPTSTDVSTGSAALRLGQTLAATAHVAGGAPDGAGGYRSPVGTATFTYCYNASMPPADCPSGGTGFGAGTGTLTPAGSGRSSTDATFTPAAQGYYVVHAQYTHADSYLDSSANSSAVYVADRMAPTVTTQVSTSSISVGGSATDTATVTGTAPFEPTGTVTFLYCFSAASAPTAASCTVETTTGTLGAVAVSGGTSAVDGIAAATSPAIPSTDPGWYRILAVYSGDVNYAPAVDLVGTNELVWVYTATTTTLTVAAVTPTPTYGAPVSMTATVRGSAGTLASGTITFRDEPTSGTGGRILTTCLVPSSATGTAYTCPTVVVQTLPVGNHKLTAAFVGSGPVAPSTGVVVPYAVAKATAPVGLLSANQVDTSWRFTATLTPPSSGSDVTGWSIAAPGGKVTFKDGTATIGSCTLDPAPTGPTSCTFTYAFPTLGNHSITASYGGDASYLPTATTATIMVERSTVTNVTAAPASTLSSKLTYGTNVVLTAKVTAALGVPGGSVTFSAIDGSRSLSAGSCKLGTTGSCSVTWTRPPVGNWTVTGYYGGSTTYYPSSGSVGVYVRKVPTTTRLASSASTVKKPKTVTLTATVGTSAAGAGTPTGTVTFMFTLGSTTVTSAPVALVSGKATYSAWPTSSTGTGSWTITATYSGDANFEPSTSPSVTVGVQ